MNLCDLLLKKWTKKCSLTSETQKYGGNSFGGHRYIQFFELRTSTMLPYRQHNQTQFIAQINFEEKLRRTCVKGAQCTETEYRCVFLYVRLAVILLKLNHLDTTYGRMRNLTNCSSVEC